MTEIEESPIPRIDEILPENPKVRAVVFSVLKLDEPIERINDIGHSIVAKLVNEIRAKEYTTGFGRMNNLRGTEMVIFRHIYTKMRTAVDHLHTDISVLYSRVTTIASHSSKCLGENVRTRVAMLNATSSYTRSFFDRRAECDTSLQMLGLLSEMDARLVDAGNAIGDVRRAMAKINKIDAKLIGHQLVNDIGKDIPCVRSSVIYLRRFIEVWAPDVGGVS